MLLPASGISVLIDIDMALRGRDFLETLEISARSMTGRCTTLEEDEEDAMGGRWAMPISSRNAQFDDGSPDTSVAVGSADVETRRGLSLGVVFPACSTLSGWVEVEADHGWLEARSLRGAADAIELLVLDGTWKVKRPTGKDRPLPFPMVAASPETASPASKVMSMLQPRSVYKCKSRDSALTPLLSCCVSDPNSP